MNKLAMLLAVSFAIPVSVAAQDDMYFVPSESADAPVSEVAEEPAPTYYIGSQRDVDEYNRQGTYVQQIDSAGNDIIDFDGTVGVYPDSLRDYECTRQMSRFDDYSWFEPYWAGYNDGRRKTFFCLACNLLECSEIRRALVRLREETSPRQPLKERAALAVGLLEGAAARQGVS